MMAFITHCSKKLLPSWVRLFAAVMLCLSSGLAGAQAETPDGVDASGTPLLTVTRADNAIFLSANFGFELPAVVEDALLKGIPIYFVAQADLLRERWYWANKKVASVQRRMRLAYHPLTRRWRLNVGSGDMTEATQGLSLGQNFDSLADVMAAVRRISRWKVADTADIDPGSAHVLEFRFALDTSQLPRPLQIGTVGQSDWSVILTASQVLAR